MEATELRSLVEEQLALTRRLKDQVRRLKEESRAPLAVVGTALRLPGGLTAPDQYWDFLNGGADATSEFPEDRPGLRSVYDPQPGRPGTSYVSRAALIDDIASFDAAFFGISRREAESLDPQQRLMLEVAWEAMERAGIAIRRGRRLDAGVFVGIMAAEYTDRLTRGADLDGIDPYYGTGGGHAFAAGRVSHALGLSGPAVSVDTACSSSLVALHQAAQSLRRGECRYALVGGANALFSPELMVSLCQSRALAPDGRSKPFLASADGYGRGEGVGALVLMRLEEAEREGRPVLAVLRGSAVNHDGASSGLTVPNGPAQQEVLRSALADAGLRPEEVSYVEAHGTGTSLGDPIEAGALQEVYGGSDREAPLKVGSVKARLGHLEAASGVAALIKVVLMLRHGTVPAARAPEDGPLNPHIPWDTGNLEVPDRAAPWPEHARVAGVSAFGLSGTNAHAL
ncbi:beta-ketoacyl [acyl carrier protein] synthase domain-containing protein, partial [Nocardiopsis lucentensis]|uniref:beta-ketoacyl [acyl carrier protein] synthase domain-containing protein n=1 Tax=Nocardiopsis lucentensis TaxID=53441 RepID=UPI00059285E3